MTVASGLALVVVLAGALIITLNGPSRGEQGIAPESTIAAVAVAPPTKPEIPTTEPEPTATRAPLRTMLAPPKRPPSNLRHDRRQRESLSSQQSSLRRAYHLADHRGADY